MTTKKIKQGDTGSVLEFTLVDLDRRPINLSGQNTTVMLVLAGGNTAVKAIKTCEHLTVNGTCDYTFVADDWSGESALVPGKYKLECAIDTGTVEVTTIDQGDLEILEAL